MSHVRIAGVEEEALCPSGLSMIAARRWCVERAVPPSSIHATANFQLKCQHVKGLTVVTHLFLVSPGIVLLPRPSN